MDRPLCLIVNPAAGNGRSMRVLPQVTAILDQAGTEHRVFESASLGHARELAAQAAQRGDAVVAVGGDGLVGALAGIAAVSGTPVGANAPQAGDAGGLFGIVPAGRGNDLARVLGVPAEPGAAARVLTGGQHRRIDLIGVAAPGQPEQVVAGSVYAGIPSLAGQIANTIDWLPGWLVYNVAALRALAAWQPVQFTVQASRPAGPEPADERDPHTFRGYAVIVANNPYFGAGLRVAPNALIDDGTLDIVLMRDAPKRTFLRALLKVKKGTHIDLPEVDLVRAAEVTVSTNRDLPAAADGEPLRCASPLAAGATLRIRALPGALRVLVPAGSVTVAAAR